MLCCRGTQKAAAVAACRAEGATEQEQEPSLHLLTSQTALCHLEAERSRSFPDTCGHFDTNYQCGNRRFSRNRRSESGFLQLSPTATPFECGDFTSPRTQLLQQSLSGKMGQQTVVSAVHFSLPERQRPDCQGFAETRLPLGASCKRRKQHKSAIITVLDTQGAQTPRMRPQPCPALI